MRLLRSTALFRVHPLVRARSLDEDDADDLAWGGIDVRPHVEPSKRVPDDDRRARPRKDVQLRRSRDCLVGGGRIRQARRQGRGNGEQPFEEG
jgi:hypothetical protein